jgi:hypothetical protein
VDFVEASGIEAELVGEFALKGVAGKQRIYTASDAALAPAAAVAL